MMGNQHRKIVGYRELSSLEIDLMNRVKTLGAELLAVQAEVVKHLAQEQQAHIEGVSMWQAVIDGPAMLSAEQHNEADTERDLFQAELDRIKVAEPARWAAIAKTDIQTGIMALVRAVAQPTV